MTNPRWKREFLRKNGVWRVIVIPQDNTGLKWDKVQAIVIDFHVFVEGFKHTPA
jgi:hypothetical protein